MVSRIDLDAEWMKEYVFIATEKWCNTNCSMNMRTNDKTTMIMLDNHVYA